MLAEAEGVAVERSPTHKARDASTQLDAAASASARSTSSRWPASCASSPPISSTAGTAGSSTSTPRCCPAHEGLRTHEAVARGRRAGHAAAPSTWSPPTRRGPILGQAEVAILPGDTPDTLAERVLIAEHQLYPRMLAEFVAREVTPDWLLDRSATPRSPCPRPRRNYPRLARPSSSRAARCSLISAPITTATTASRCWSRSAGSTSRHS